MLQHPRSAARRASNAKPIPVSPNHAKATTAICSVEFILTGDHPTPFALWALTISAFAVGTTKFVIVGLLPTIVDSLGVSLPSAGLLVSLYASGVTIGAPVLTAATGGLPRKTKNLT